MVSKPIREGFQSVVPFLSVQGADGLAAFLSEAFGAKQTFQSKSGTHFEVRIGDSMVMLTDGGGDWKPMPAVLYLYVTDADAVYEQALEAGGTSVMEPVTQFFGDRHGGVRDPSGNVWWISTHVEDVSPDELKKRVDAHIQRQSKS